MYNGDQLIAVLKEENNVLKKLIKIAYEKTDVLSAANIDRINNMISAEQELKIELDTIEKKREYVVNQIANSLGIDKTILTISYIIDNTNDYYKEQLNLLKNEIQQKLHEYKQVNDLNTALIKNNLNFIDYMFNTLAGQQYQPVTYGCTGYANQEKKRNSFIDNKA